MVMKLLCDPDGGRLLGAQIVGIDGVDKRIDVLATALYAGLSASDLASIELSYAPQFGTGKDAVNLRIAEQYLLEFGKLAKESNTMIMPSNLADISSIIATATKVFDATKE
jgi:hypothetical protein